MSDEYQRLPLSDQPWPIAEYKEQELDDYKGNPLIEALPPILSADEAYHKLLFSPTYHEEERNLSAKLRFNALRRLQQFFQPLYRHLELERDFSLLIRSGYLSRNPLDPSHVRQLSGFVAPGVRSTASSITFMGFSGMGKTTTIERILSLYPQCILHNDKIHCYQIVWLKLNCPHDGSLKTLCIDFFLKIDDMIGTNYYQKFGNKRNSISSMVTFMGRVARLHNIGALIIDEIQHLLTAKDKGSEQMMNFFVTLINEIGIPVMLIGTMRARAILQQDFRQARRGSGLSNPIWDKRDPDEDWDMLIEEMWKYQWIHHQVPLTDELRKAMHEESQGIVDIAVKLYSLAQARAIETGRETITTSLIHQVAREDLKLVQPMLNALRTGMLSEIEKYEDIMPMDIASYLQKHQSKIDLRATIQKKKEEQANERQQFDLSVTAKVIHALISLDIDAKTAEKAVLHVQRESGSKSQTQLFTEALAFIESKKTEPKSVAPKEKKRNLLAEIVEKGKQRKQSTYESLKEAGYIQDPVKLLMI